jgi:hypothetical protein
MVILLVDKHATLCIVIAQISFGMFVMLNVPLTSSVWRNAKRL